MFDIFGIRARRKAKREAEEAARLAEQQERKRKYQERKAKITDYIKAYDHDQFNKTWEANKKHEKFAEEANSKCPKCGSTNVINRITRTKGEIHGKGEFSSYSSSSHFLFGSSSHHSGGGYSEIDGELDTLPVNKCKDCGHEWQIKEPYREKEDDIFSAFDYTNERLFDKVKDYYKLKYDPDDVTEECNSLEEVREKYIKEAQDHWCLKKFRGHPKYMIEYAFWQGMTKYSWYHEGYERRFGYSESLDQYSYTMPDELWEIVKKLLDWQGKEE